MIIDIDSEGPMTESEFKYLQINAGSADDYVILYPPSSRWYPCPTRASSFVDKSPRVEVSGWKTSWPVAILWNLLSSLVALTCTVGFVQAEWFVREELSSGESSDAPLLTYDRNSLLYTLGMFNICYRDLDPSHFSCYSFGTHLGFSYFPSITWQSTCILYGSGCVLQGCGAVIALFSLCALRERQRRGAAQLVSHLHIIAGLLQTASLLLYPTVLGTHVGRLHCGPGTAAYSPAQCRVGWAYVAATAGTLLTYYCPFLAYFSSYRIYNQNSYWDV